MSTVVGYVLNTNGLSLAPAGDSEYIEVVPEDRDAVVDEILSGGDEVPEDVNVVRTLVVADLVSVYDAAKALIESERQPSDAPDGRRYGDAFSNAFTALDNAVAVAGR